MQPAVVARLLRALAQRSGGRVESSLFEITRSSAVLQGELLGGAQDLLQQQQQEQPVCFF